MAGNTGKVATGLGLGALAIGLLAAFGGKKKPTGGLQGTAPKSGCNCGR